MTSSSLSTDAVDLLACEVLADLYRAYCGAAPLAVRAYRDEEALLLLLRFEPDPRADGADDDLDPLVGTALRAMPCMIASAVEARTGTRLAPGDLSLCSARGLAVFAFSGLVDEAEQSLDDDIFRIDIIGPAASAPSAVRLAS